MKRAWCVAGTLLAACTVVFARRGAKPRPASDEGHAPGVSRLQDARAEIAQGRWAEACEKLQVAIQLEPGDPEIAQALQEAEAEVPRAEAVERARAALVRRDFAHARAALAEVPQGSALAAPARDVQRELRGAMEQAVRAAKMALDAGDPARAAALLEPVRLADSAWPSVPATLRADSLALRSPRRAAKPTRATAPTPPLANAGVREIYLAGYVAKEGDPAAARDAFRRVVAMLPAEDETARKAKHWLDKLEKTGAKER